MTGRIIEISDGHARVELGDGIHASCRIDVASPAAENNQTTGSPSSKPDLSSLGSMLQDVIDDFQKLTQKDLPAINNGLRKKKQEVITVLAEAEWQKKKEESSAAAGAGMRATEIQMREMD